MHPQKEHAAVAPTPQEHSNARRKFIAKRQKFSFWQIAHLLGSLCRTQEKG